MSCVMCNVIYLSHLQQFASEHSIKPPIDTADNHTSNTHVTTRLFLGGARQSGATKTTVDDQPLVGRSFQRFHDSCGSNSF